MSNQESYKNNFIYKKRHYYEDNKYDYRYYIIHKFVINTDNVRVLYKKKIDTNTYKKIKNISKQLDLFNKNFTIIGSSYCSYCTKATDFLKKEKISYEYIDRTSFSKTDTFLYKNLMKHMTNNYKYIPKIFYNGVFIGGYSDLLIFYKKYNLDNLDTNPKDKKNINKINKI